MQISRLIAATLTVFAAAAWADTAPPQYSIIDLGAAPGTSASQAFAISPDGDTVVGRSIGNSTTGNPAFVWTAASGLQNLPNVNGRLYAAANGVNDSGAVVGTSGVNFMGASPLPLLWQNGAATQLALPIGYSYGGANAINASGTVVGYVGSGLSQRAAIFGVNSSTVISATTADGSFMNVAFRVTDNGLVIGSGQNLNNAAVNVGLVYNTVTGTMTSLGALPGLNGTIPFGSSNSGYIVGSSMFNQGMGMPFIWSASGGTQAIPLADGTDHGMAKAVNDQGWVVGVDANNYAVPFLYANGTTYTLASLLPANSGWDFLTNTSASALGITNDGSIIGTAKFNGVTHAYLMTLVSSVPEPGSWALMGAGLALVGLRRRQQKA